MHRSAHAAVDALPGTKVYDFDSVRVNSEVIRDGGFHQDVGPDPRPGSKIGWCMPSKLIIGSESLTRRIIRTSAFGFDLDTFDLTTDSI